CAREGPGTLYYFDYW
nr:immunoglobulin heavy chain junction region [Mus musculus]